jgi:cation diffusion facilitator CzcD-associated flavoprotein CzcO
VVVIGGSQAGLAMAWHLARQRLRFVVLEAGPEPGHIWRSRWDSHEDAAYLADRITSRARTITTNSEPSTAQDQRRRGSGRLGALGWRDCGFAEGIAG